MIVTIDGPAGSGKSTVARQLAKRLRIAYLDTGAMYRAIALKALSRNVPLDDSDALAGLATESAIRFEPAGDGQRVVLDDADVTEPIRTMQVNATTPHVAKVPAVRKALVDKQRQLGARLGSLVAEGRDQGSVVFPQADVKFVLEGDVETRAQRRYAELTAAGQQVDYQTVRDNLIERDKADEKHWLGLLEPGAAVVVDTTGMDIDQVVDTLHRAVMDRVASGRTMTE